MTLAELVVGQAPQLEESRVTHYALADIFTIGYDSTLIGYYDPQNHNLTLDGKAIDALERY